MRQFRVLVKEGGFWEPPACGTWGRGLAFQCLHFQNFGMRMVIIVALPHGAVLRIRLSYCRKVLRALPDKCTCLIHVNYHTGTAIMAWPCGSQL